MAYDQNGTWTMEDSSVQKQVEEITGKDSSLMRQAKTSGLQTANERGLLNSSTAIKAAQNAVLGAATPIASQTASQINQNNMLKSQQTQETEQNRLNRAQTEQLAQWNLAADRQSKASAMIASMEQLYSNDYNSIMSNTNLGDKARASQLSSMMARRDQMLSFVEQMYDIDLTWSTPTVGSTSSTK